MHIICLMLSDRYMFEINFVIFLEKYVKFPFKFKYNKKKIKTKFNPHKNKNKKKQKKKILFKYL